MLKYFALILAVLALFSFPATTNSNMDFFTPFSFPTSTPTTYYISIIDLNGSVETAWVDTVKSYLKDDNCLLTILNINSGGGSVTTSMAVTHAFKKLQKKYEKPIIIYSSYGIFSGAYMVATSGELIGISPGASTGSIGVFAVHVNQLEYYKQKGITFDIVKSGNQKASWSSIVNWTDEQRKVAQQEVDYWYNLFIDIILINRPTVSSKFYPEASWPTLKDSLTIVCDGRAYIPTTALNYGLIDKICYLDDYIKYVCRYYLIPGSINIYHNGEKKELDNFLYE